MNPTDIEALITDLRQPGGDERELSDRVALALGWRAKVSDTILGPAEVLWQAPDEKEWEFNNPPLFTDDISALARDIEAAGAVYRCEGGKGVTGFGGIALATETTMEMRAAPTAARALCIARLMLRERTGR